MKLESNPGFFKVLSAEQLLNNSHRQNLLNKAQSIVSLPQHHYQELVKRLIENVAVFVQQLPASQREYHPEPGGLLDFSLEAMSAALGIRRGFMLPLGASPEVVAKKQELWTYGVLTAALLKQIGPALSQCAVRLYDEKQQLVKAWEPLRELMINHAYYDLRFVGGADNGLGHRMNLLFVRSLVPKEGIAWLASDPDIMNQWLATLMGDGLGGGVIHQIIERSVQQQALKVKAAQLAVETKPKSIPSAPRESTVPTPLPSEPQAPKLEELVEEENGAPELQQDIEISAYGLMASTSELPPQGGGQDMPTLEPSADLGEFFIQWFRKSLADKKILFNQDSGPVHVVPEGVFLVAPEIFQKFVDTYPDMEVQATSVQNRFQKLKLHKKHEGLNLFNYASYHTGKRIVFRGYVIEKVDEVLPAGFELPEPNSHLELDFV